MSKKYLVAALISLAAVLVVLICILVSVFAFKEDEEYAPAALNGADGSDGKTCILVLGKDKASGLFDVVMLVSFDTKDASACVMQIPRDTYAEYTQKSYKKINAAPRTLGEDGFCEFLSESLGVNITGYISFELDAFGKAVDLIGGVEMTLPRALDYNDPEQGLYIHLPAGKQVLDGEKAQMLVRFRKGYVRGDLDRLDVQKQFMAAFFCKVKDTVNILNAYRFVNELFPCVKTDMSATSLVSLGLKALSVKPQGVGFVTLPGEDAKDGGSSYYVMSREATDEIVGKYFGKADGQIDPNGLFLNEKSAKFTAIYNKRYEYSLMFADEIQ